jgi:hypothetical protein
VRRIAGKKISALFEVWIFYFFIVFFLLLACNLTKFDEISRWFLANLEFVYPSPTGETSWRTKNIAPNDNCL